ncbi:hypothetical protein EN836_32705 [Mesorhizobium sp. M1C.F.Ca.ET.193.01.1.1]|uniref:hypothetical protein n=1 Tax=unclassified Mesorhizobium TaxID=325217 RepID=UPI000FD3BF8F|nr:MULTISPECIES: hypothetical protein [unclassified Mesorhizobium]TGS91084.1 hypothetical protein EN820_53320 [bacterium M00.F.Ca.ET.177.01.1.1]RWK03009.1 MAG: hypothetical protein EOR39_30180 [Mesorhizobium sp.]TGQ49672.1 hypothetical protein EN853_32700 [Mesorhizobium sp. M1C.F.Ca.ET.210.01.1.1]TGQ63810.1 hypothetical protein EN855_032715 [Mesorhizobium sp. M1C.F.Ca.ET.212.01.1.1]TGQ97687.1 hypothetical protein EN847_32585 [Mesorhizobium sp. M1C.F.Ca.ET.204.01.1.1]
MLERAWQIWQRDYRILGAIMFAFGLALFLPLTPSGQARAHEFGIFQRVSPAKVVLSIADFKVDRAASTKGVPSATAADDTGCHDGAAQADCSLCGGGHCFGCPALIPAATPGIGFVPGPDAPALLDQAGLTLTKPDEAFRPPRSVL